MTLCPLNYNCDSCMNRNTLNCPIEYEKREDEYMEDIFGEGHVDE